LKTARSDHPELKLQVSTLVTEQNKTDLSNIIDLMIDLKVSDYYMAQAMIKFNNDKVFWYLPLKDMGKYVLAAYQHASKKKFPLKFMEVPYCVFGFYDESIINNCLPPDHGSFCQPRKEVSSWVKDLPSYRVKIKIDMCGPCKYSHKCDGLIKNDVDRFGVDSLKAIN
jgi:MoaA/NifB/PqqE/SkfB family radical SAM enzyme